VRRAPRVSPVWLVLGGILSVQFGAGVAKTLFDEVAPTTIVWLRLVTSAVLLLAIARPVLRGRTRQDWLVVLAFGLALGLMNWSIYEAMDRIPLGIAVTIEFWGPLAVAVVGSRRARDFAWVVLAAIAIYILTGSRLIADDALGVAAAFAAGALWAIYIPIGGRVAREWPDGRGLTVAMAVAGALSLLVAAAGGALGQALGSPSLILGGLVIALFSSAIPYSLEIAALDRIPAATFGVLMSIEPAVAALVGLVFLGQGLSALEVVAIAMIVVASAGASLSARSMPIAPADPA